MPFIGNQPAESYSAFQKQDFTTSATTSYTLDHPVSNQNEIALFINFVRQEPTTAYTASGTSLTLTSATSASDDMYCVFLGKAVQTVNPPNSSVGSSQVSADLITGQTALGATPADTDELLISDAGTLKRVDYSYLKSANTPAFEALLGSDQSISNNTQTKVQFGTENFDTDNCYDNSTNYRFTPTTSGKYFIYSTLSINNGQNVGIAAHLEIRKNGARVFLTQTNVFNNTVLNVVSVSACSILTLNGSSDYVEIFGLGENNSGTPKFLGTAANGQCIFGAYKIIE